MKKLEKKINEKKSFPIEKKNGFTILIDEGMNQVKGGSNDYPNIGTTDYAGCGCKITICVVV